MRSKRGGRRITVDGRKLCWIGKGGKGPGSIGISRERGGAALLLAGKVWGGIPPKHHQGIPSAAASSKKGGLRGGMENHEAERRPV